MLQFDTYAVYIYMVYMDIAVTPICILSVLYKFFSVDHTTTIIIVEHSMIIIGISSVETLKGSLKGH